MFSETVNFQKFIFGDISHSNVDPVLIQHQALLITVSTNGLTPDGARPSVGTVLNTELDMFSP